MLDYLDERISVAPLDRIADAFVDHEALYAGVRALTSYDAFLAILDDGEATQRAQGTRRRGDATNARCAGRHARWAARKPTGGGASFACVRNATHELIGVTLAVAAGQALKAGPLETGGLAAAALIASRLPDVDLHGARIHRRSRLERRNLLAGAAGALLRLPLVAFAALISHRGVTHSALSCAAVPGLAALLAYPAGAGAALVVGGGSAIGYAAHVAADGCTPGGIRLWAPFSRRRVWLLPPRARIRTGSARETAVAAVAVAALVSLVLV